MSIKKESAASVATTGSGDENHLLGDVAYYTKNQDINQGIVSHYLQKGAENAILAKDLAKMIGISSIRFLQVVISRERQDGILILSSDKGYFLPDDGEKGREEIKRFVTTYRAMALSTLRILKTANRALRNAEGQYSLLKEDD